MDALRKDNHYTYSDYITWDDRNRYELIDGATYMMSPSPSRMHQEITGELLYKLKDFLKGKPCKVYTAPFDVRLNAGGEDDTVVQPDLVVVCDESKLDDKGCKGTPDLIIEIISPSTARYDKVIKLNQYLKSGVREYWIVEPDSKTVASYILKNGQYIIRPYSEEDTAEVHVLEGCLINLHDVFSAY